MSTDQVVKVLDDVSVAPLSETSRRVARVALKYAGIVPDEATFECHRLAALLERVMGEALAEAKALGLGADDDTLAVFEGEQADADEHPERYRVLWLDAALLRALARYDIEAAREARRARVEAATPKRDEFGCPSLARWRLWLADGRNDEVRWADNAPWPVAPSVPAGWLSVAQALWRLYGEAWAQMRAGAGWNLPALVRPVSRMLAIVMGGHVEVQCDRVEVKEKSRELIGIAEPLGLVDREAARVVAEGLARFGLKAGHKLVDELVCRAWRAFRAGAQDYRNVRFPGGFRGLHEALGVTRKHRDMLRAIVEAGQHVTWNIGRRGGGGALWAWSLTPGEGPGRPQILEFALGHLLLPGLPSDAFAKGDRILVPVLRHEPPMTGIRERDHGAAWALARFFVAELVDNAVDVATMGGAMITLARWRDLARAAGFPVAGVDRLLVRWREGDAKAPPLIVEVKPGRFNLAPAHDLEREFVENGGRLRLEQSNRGRYSTNLRRARRLGLRK